ncbi:lipopolysaccharide biosynthesis protein [Sphingomonas sp. M1A8_2b]
MITSLKSNMIASYGAQIYVALAGIVMLPLYLRFMGNEAYGLVAIFVMLQAWLLLLDMGLSPTLAREMAQFRAGVLGAQEVRRLLHLLEAVFAIVATLTALAMIVGAPWLAKHWLRIEHLSLGTVETSLMIMAPALSLRLCSGLYRGAVSGLERIIWLSGFNAVIATARYALVIPWLLLLGSNPVGFFAFQLVVAIVEVVALRLKCHALMRGTVSAHAAVSAPRRLRTVLFFSFSVGIGASLWSIISQVDKLILSRLLTLADYGYFSLAVVAASGVALAAGPITFALSPRLAHLHAAGRVPELLDLYRRSTQLIAVIAASTATILACFASAVLWAWTGRADLAQRASSTLALYAAGNAASALSAMVFFLQFAMGDLRLHVRGLILMLVILLPALLWGTLHYGIAGAGGAWLGVNMLYLLVWTAIVHRRFAPGLHLAWLFGDVMRIAVPTAMFGIAARMLLPLPQGRLPLIACLAVLGAGALTIAVVSSPALRRLIAAWVGMRIASLRLGRSGSQEATRPLCLIRQRHVTRKHDEHRASD